MGVVVWGNIAVYFSDDLPHEFSVVLPTFTAFFRKCCRGTPRGVVCEENVCLLGVS